MEEPGQYHAVKGQSLMSLNASNSIRPKRRGFTLVEVMVSSFVAVYVFLCAWSMYMMGWTWWHEILPQTECQRIARVAASVIIKGSPDSTIGTDTINFVTYKKRNGVKESSRTYADSQDASFITPTITSDGHRINFKLEPDPTSSNVRSFYLGQDADGVKAVYYQVGNATPQIIKSTKGITDLVFEEVGLYNNIIKVTATAQKTVAAGGAPYQISVEYSDHIYLRNV